MRVFIFRPRHLRMKNQTTHSPTNYHLLMRLPDEQKKYVSLQPINTEITT